MSLPEVVAALLIGAGSGLILLNLWLSDEPPPQDNVVAFRRFAQEPADETEWRRAA